MSDARPAVSTSAALAHAEDPRLEPVRFQGTLRPSQQDVVTIAEQKRKEGAERLHVVAPPGAGKTILGLYIFAHVVRRPTLVLAPNAAIQAQWAARADLFGLDPQDPAQVSMDPKHPALLTSLTYQAVTLPERASEDLDASAISLWKDRLIESGEANGFEEAAAWIEDLQRRNPTYHGERLGAYRKAARDELGREGRSLETLADSARATMDRLRAGGLGFIILDECHHLLGHWGRVLADARPLFEGVVTLGLTATPPGGEGADRRDADRYRAFFGPIDYEVPVLDRYVRRKLRRSPDATDQALAQRVIDRLRILGIQITETGARACASPASRILACSVAKTQAVVEILTAEHEALGDGIRAVVVADFERSSAVASEIASVLDAEAGGAVAAFRAILASAATNVLDPILLTGSTVLIDADIADKVVGACRAWLFARGLEGEVDLEEEDGFRVLKARGGDWCTRVYIEMLTELFQQGLTRCLVGTRGLLGEGWDANRTNVLVDLTAVTTSMSVNQLRGRSFRLDPQDPEKVADNWDVCCIAPELVRGLSDYHRFCKKHDQLFGVTDDGVIEKGVGHVHAAFRELAPADVEGSVGVLNQEMLARASQRATVRAQWKVGEPYHPDPLPAVEVRLRPPPAHDEEDEAALVSDLPPFAAVQTPWSETSLTLAIGESLLGALREIGAVARGGALHAGERAGGYVRAFMAGATPEDARLFQHALGTALGPLERPRYVIPRYVERIEGGWLARILPRILARYMTRRKRRLSMLHAVPDPLGRSKETIAILERHWNAHVSPGQAIYAFHGKGKRLLAKARKKGQVPASVVHIKEVFL